MKQQYRRRCNECDEYFYSTDKDDGLCNKCYYKIQMKISARAKNKRKSEDNTAVKQIQFHEIIKAAKAEGLSYGKYCLKHGLV